MPEQPTKADHPEKQESELAPATLDKSATPRKTTAEEQMAAFEEDLKDNDWGHQPC